MERQLNGVEQEVILTNNNLLLRFSGDNDLLVLKQWKGALNPRPSQNNDLGLRARSLFLRRPWNEGIILYRGLRTFFLAEFLFSKFFYTLSNVVHTAN